MLVDLENVRTEASTIPDSRLKSETRSRAGKHRPRGRGNWLSAGLYPEQKYKLEVWGHAAFPPKQLLTLLTPLLQAKPMSRAPATWRKQDDATLIISTGLPVVSTDPSDLTRALRMLLMTLIVLDRIDPTATELKAAS